ncbi:MAG TPA: cytochrome ubiquinol oxidase subunit I [Caulobacteraceae bacterium]|nr:cytochrome ubiquinol oxidase subunit I [Caulobacteraceae bacterium]
MATPAQGGYLWAMPLDALLLSRLQFAFTLAFHIIFPSLSIGLASFLAVLEGLWLFTKREAFQRLYLFWLKIFAISFGMGVVTGVVMSYQFGTNWSVFSKMTAGVLGPLLAYEVLTAFFLESSFLGVMLFGWKRVGPCLHFTATCLVAFGTLVSAFWIISANSWMQVPTGYALLPDGRFVARDWLAVILSPSFPQRLAHMVLAAYLSTALLVAAAAAFQIWRDRAQAESRIALRMAIGMFVVVAPLQLFVGDYAGKQLVAQQPAKLAAIEAFWDTRPAQDFHIVAWPDRARAGDDWELSLPKLGSWITTGDANATLRGLKSFPPQDRPPVAVVFWSFRVMVGLGFAMIGLGLWGGALWLRRGLERSRLFLAATMLMGPAGFAAVVAGWITAEVGRQPWVVYGLMRTRDAVSPVGVHEVQASLLAFLAVYALIFSAGVLYILRLIAQGPEAGVAEPPAPTGAPGSAFAAAPPEPTA